MTARPGLRWEEVLFGFEPRWTHEPDLKVIEHIASKALSQPCNVSFFGQGAFNKLYHIQCGQPAPSDYMMRVSLPVDPKFKTLSEVATLAWVQQHTSLPVPSIVAYDCSYENELGFEWIIMDKVPGRPLADVWDSMTWTGKEKLVTKIADYSKELFLKRFSEIGNLFTKPYDAGHRGVIFPQSTDTTTSSFPSTENITSTDSTANSTIEGFTLGRIVSMQFFWADHFTYDVARGPFKSSSDWLLERLKFNQLSCEQTIRESDDEDDIEEAEKTLSVVKRLAKAPSLVFAGESRISTVLLHDDLSWHNILVDDDGELQGIIDWECVSTVPLWKAVCFPKFLEGRERTEKPLRDNLNTDEGGENLFKIKSLEYEQTQFRGVFSRAMGLDWVRLFQCSQKQADLDIAIQSCDLHNFARKCIHEWLDELEEGKEPASLVARFSP